MTKSKSPAKKLRSYKRLISFLLSKKKTSTSTLSISHLANVDVQPMFPNSLDVPDLSILSSNIRKPNLTTSTYLTNFPEPCQVCKKNQCQYDLTHQLSNSISKAIEKSFEELNSNGVLEKAIDKFNRKLEPPDDAAI